MAGAAGQAERASADYATALAANPDDSPVALHAYRAALDAGDDALARRAAAVLVRAGAAPADTALLAISDAARANDAGAVDKAAARLAAGPLKILIPALAAWTAEARGADPLPALGEVRGDAVTRRFAAEQRALLLLARGDVASGVGAIRVLGPGDDGLDLRLAGAELLYGQGHGREAQALVGGDGPAERAYRLTSVPAKPTLAFGVSRLLTGFAADLAEGDPTPLTVALTRAAIAADPHADRARLMLATALARDGETDAALAALAPLTNDRPLAALAGATRVAILNGAARPEALAAARAQADARGATPDDQARYADMLFAADRFEQAAHYYKRALDAAPSWQAWMQYGGALDRAGKWKEGRAALEKAVALAPDQPLALNYLGYARIARGEEVAASARLIERARALDPENADIADSLGWARFLARDPAGALPLLEGAAKAEASVAEINEHLGDTYWALGRRYEARYAWRAAALTAPASDAVRLQAKIADGVPARP